MDFSIIPIELVLFAAAVLAGFLDTLAGGGGLITIPALMMCGLPPLAVLGTNKMQASFGTATASWVMLRNRRFDRAIAGQRIGYALIGAAAGTCIVQFMNVESLSLMIPVVLVVIAVYFLLSPLIGLEPAGRMSERLFRMLIVPVISMYDGMFGPGTGSFFALAGVHWRGRGVVEATAEAKPLNFASSTAALVVFAGSGSVMWKAGLVMIFGQFIGASLGAHSLFRINPGFLRYLIVLMCAGMLVKYSMSMGWI